MKANEHPCDEFAELVSGQLDGELTVGERDRLAHHLQDCFACREFSNDLGELDRICRGEVVRPSERARQRVIAEFGRGRARRWALAASAMAAATCIFLVSYLASPQQPNGSRAAPFIEALTTIDYANRQTRRDQQTLVDNMELNLRSLDLKLQYFDLEESERQKLRKKLKQIHQKLKQVDKQSIEPGENL